MLDEWVGVEKKVIGNFATMGERVALSNPPPNSPLAARKSFVIKQRKSLEKHKSRTIAGRKCKKHGKKASHMRPGFPWETRVFFQLFCVGNHPDIHAESVVNGGNQDDGKLLLVREQMFRV